MWLLGGMYKYCPPHVCVCRSLDSVLGVRSLLISRSTYTGGGAVTGHWLGDNTSQWKHLKASIPGQLQALYTHHLIMVTLQEY